MCGMCRTKTQPYSLKWYLFRGWSNETEWADTPAHHYQKDKVLYPSLPFFSHHVLCVFSDTCITPGTGLIHLNSRPFMQFMLWVVFWNFSQSNQVIDETDASAIKCDSGLCGFEQGRRKIGAGAQKKRSRRRRKGKTDLILSAAGNHLFGLSTHQTYAVALCHLKQIFQLKLKSFPY